MLLFNSNDMKKQISPSSMPRKGKKAHRSKNMSMLDNYYGNSSEKKSSMIAARSTFFSTPKESANNFGKLKNPEVQIKDKEIRAMLFPTF